MKRLWGDFDSISTPSTPHFQLPLPHPRRRQVNAVDTQIFRTHKNRGLRKITNFSLIFGSKSNRKRRCPHFTITKCFNPCGRPSISKQASRSDPFLSSLTIFSKILSAVSTRGGKLVWSEKVQERYLVQCNCRRTASIEPSVRLKLHCTSTRHHFCSFFWPQTVFLRVLCWLNSTQIRRFGCLSDSDSYGTTTIFIHTGMLFEVSTLMLK